MWRLLFSNKPATVPQLWLRGSLANGQVFNFTCEIQKEEGVEIELWTGVVCREVVRLKQRSFGVKDSQLMPVYFWSKDDENEMATRSLLERFFRANIDIDSLYRRWSDACPRFAKIAPAFRGIRLLDQEPVECLFSFIASTNNHINRIAQMLHKLREAYGEEIPGEPGFKAFPTPDNLATHATEQALRSLGFGYRAKYVVVTAKAIEAGRRTGSDSLQQLRNPEISTAKVREELLAFAGVGPKVADCVALFSCNRLDIVPVDVHVFTLARRSYDADGLLSNLTTVSNKSYKVVTQLFHNRFGPMAGWAHSVLFTSELRQFQDRLTDELRRENTLFQREKADLKKRTGNKEANTISFADTPSAKKSKSISNEG